jgi:hypothetical protein
MMQNSQIERKFNKLSLNRQYIFQTLNLENDQPDNHENESFESEELKAFLNISKELGSGGATGSEIYPGEFLPPMKENFMLSDSLLNLLIEYYNRAYPEYNFSRPLLDSSISNNENYVAVTGKVTKCGRLRIGAEYFGSILSKRHIRSSYILAHFIDRHDNEIDTYPGQVQCYFEHTIHLPNGSLKHHLAYVKWYKSVTTADIRFLFANEDSDDFTNDPELWRKESFKTSVDNIIPVHHILGRFVPANFKFKKTDYLAVLPLNRRFHI